MELSKVQCVLDSIESVLIIKNKRYGNSALSPINVFYKGDATNSICIRLDDKVSRIKNSDVLRKNDLFDLLGYLYLLCISINYTKNKELIENSPFTDRVYDISANINFKLLRTSDINITINKEQLNKDFDVIKDDNCYDNIYTLMLHIVLYFIQNNIDDFSDLID